MTLIIAPYKLGSRSARSIRDALRGMGTKAVTLQRQAKGVRNPILNWGQSSLSYVPPKGVLIINPPNEVAKLTNKLRFFEMFGKVGDTVPAWTKDPKVAEQWPKVMCRQKLEGSGGDGIVVWTPDKGPLPKAPLYTEYVGKTHEYRLHMAKVGDVYEPILIQRKIFKKTAERPVPDAWEVRNHANGFYFVSDNPNAEPVPEPVKAVAQKVMAEQLNGLHFCALDVIYNNKSKKALVLEGNSAPGMENDTIRIYAEYINSVYKEAV